MIKDDEKLIVYLNNLVNNVFKILPLYENKNEGLVKYIDSLLFELKGLNSVVHVKYGTEYITILSILASIKNEINKGTENHSLIKREIFKCIHVIKTLVEELEEGWYYGLHR